MGPSLYACMCARDTHVSNTHLIFIGARVHAKWPSSDFEMVFLITQVNVMSSVKLALGMQIVRSLASFAKFIAHKDEMLWVPITEWNFIIQKVRCFPCCRAKYQTVKMMTTWNSPNCWALCGGLWRESIGCCWTPPPKKKKKKKKKNNKKLKSLNNQSIGLDLSRHDARVTSQ